VATRRPVTRRYMARQGCDDAAGTACPRLSLRVRLHCARGLIASGISAIPYPHKAPSSPRTSALHISIESPAVTCPAQVVARISSLSLRKRLCG